MLANVNMAKVMAGMAMAFAVAFYAPFAFAIGSDVTVGNFSCANGAASGQLLVSGASCPTTLQIDNVFSFLLCNMEQLSGNILGHMYCGMIKELEPAVWAVATLAVIFFAISFTFGLTPATGREAIVFLLKIAFVTAFATNAEMLVKYGYTLLIGGIKEGIQMALEGMNVTGATTGSDSFKLLDEFMYKLFQYATESVSATTSEDRCKNAVFAVIATMAVAFPLLAYLALALIARVVMTFIKAAFGYIYAIVGITFLLILAPLFVPFYLFKQTRPFCEKWIGFMVSFVLQMVLLFAFLAFILSLNVSSMVKNLPNIIMYQEQTPETTSFRMPWQYCTLCSFKVVDKNDVSKELTQKDRNFVTDGKMVCKDAPPKPINLTFAIAPDTGSNEMNSLIRLAGQGVLSLIVLAIAINQILTLLPGLAVRLASGLGGGYAPQLGGGFSPYGNFSPGGSLTRDFETGFKKSMLDRTSASRAEMAESIRTGKKITLSGERAGATTKDTKSSVIDGFNAMMTGRTGSGETLYSSQKDLGIKGYVSPKNLENQLKGANKTAGLSSWRRLIDPPKD
jgi:type IV secretory pathway VirB6-like protein